VGELTEETANEWMGRALDEARAALEHGDVPIGAVVVGPDGTWLAARHNERELQHDPTAHAEILALRDAAMVQGSWRLDDCTLVVTLEPCPMCAGAVLNARIATVVFGAPDPKAGATGSLYNFAVDPRLNHESVVVPNVRAEESAALLRDFFASKRTSRAD
jgi:tRNA(adenine34) deaminase